MIAVKIGERFTSTAAMGAVTVTCPVYNSAWYAAIRKTAMMTTSVIAAGYRGSHRLVVAALYANTKTPAIRYRQAAKLSGGALCRPMSMAMNDDPQTVPRSKNSTGVRQMNLR